MAGDRHRGRRGSPPGPRARGDAARTRLLEAAGALLWWNGYDATSPAAVQRRAGVGQGSFYHHFPSKAALCGAALERASEEMKVDADAVFAGDSPPLERILAYLSRPRNGIRGCRLGRLAFDAGLADARLGGVVADYFRHVEAHLEHALDSARDAGNLAPGIDPHMVARALLAVVQGGYTLARARDDEGAVNDATAGALALLEGVAR